MKEKTADRVFDKGVDIAVVIVGILIALSIDSCREDMKSKAQWRMFAEQFKAEAKLQEDSFPPIIEFYEKRVADAQAILVKIDKGQKRIPELDQFIMQMPELQVDYPNPIVFNALVQTGNQYLINDTENLRLLGHFYHFEKLAMAYFDTFGAQFMPEYKKVLRQYVKHSKNLDPIREDLSFMMHMYIKTIGGTLQAYQRQNKTRLKVIETF